jgi:hypothetical protein
MSAIGRRHVAILAGVSALVTIAGVVVAVACGVPPDLYVAVPADRLVAHLVEVGPGLRVGVAGYLLAIVGDVLRAWALYAFFERIEPRLAALGAWMMLLHDAIWGVSLAGFLVASDLVLSGGDTEAVRALVQALVGLERYAFAIGLFCFSGHLLVNGVLALGSKEVPRLVGVLVVLAFAGYAIDALATVVLVSRPEWLTGVLAPINTVGELALAGWLALRGGREVTAAPKPPEVTPRPA